MQNDEQMRVFEDHIRDKDRAQAEKQIDKENSSKDETSIMATFDMQSILQLPTSQVGPLYYKRKLTLHNFTIYECKKPNKGFCYLWPETAGKRGANEIGSCVLRYLKSLDKTVRHVTFFSDCCSGQNRNQYVCALLLYAIRSLPLDIIEHKFLIPGHTMMECDSMHSAIETAQKNLAIYSLHEWFNVLKSARRNNPYSVELLEHTDFFDLKALAKNVMSNRRKLEKGHINWLQVRSIRFEKANPDRIFFKTDFDQTEYDVVHQPCSTRKRGNFSLKPAYSCPIPISVAKYKDLTSMLENDIRIIPREYETFYQTLPVCNTKIDCVPDDDDDDRQ